MLDKIPQQRLLLYALLVGLVPILFAVVSIMAGQNRLNELDDTLTHVEQMAYQREKKQAVNMAVKAHFSDADHFYIDKNLETLSFLEHEVESLHKITGNKNFPEDENVKKRLDFLTGDGNSMAFTEGVVQTGPFFQEVTETLVHPVEVNVSDLKQILARIEGVDIGSYVSGPHRPQLIILDFKLDKKKIAEKNEVYQLNLKLLKREFL